MLTADAAILAATLAANDARGEALRGHVALGETAAPAVSLEALGEALRAAPARHGGRLLGPAALGAVGLDAGQAEVLLKALGFVTAGRPEADGTRLWRRRRAAPLKALPLHSPFAVLARLEAPQPRRRRRRAQRV